MPFPRQKAQGLGFKSKLFPASLHPAKPASSARHRGQLGTAKTVPSVARGGGPTSGVRARRREGGREGQGETSPGWWAPGGQGGGGNHALSPEGAGAAGVLGDAGRADPPPVRCPGPCVHAFPGPTLQAPGISDSPRGDVVSHVTLQRKDQHLNTSHLQGQALSPAPQGRRPWPSRFTVQARHRHVRPNGVPLRPCSPALSRVTLWRRWKQGPPDGGGH